MKRWPNVGFGTKRPSFCRKVEYWRICSSLSNKYRIDSAFRQKLGRLVPDPTLDDVESVGLGVSTVVFLETQESHTNFQLLI